MVNKEHYARLIEGVQTWNDWRSQNPKIIPDLRGFKLIEVDLRAANLSRADLSGADLSGANLSGANLSKANLSRANLRGVDLSGVDFREAKLSGLDLRGLDLSGVDFREAKFSGVNLSGVDLSSVDLSGVDLSGVDLSKAILKGAILKGAILRELDLSGVDLSEVDLRGVSLSGVDLSRVDLSRVNLIGLDLSRVNLSGLDLSMADLSGLDLSGLDLSKSILRGLDLSKSNLRGAILSGANLSKANLSKADLSKADLSRVDLRAANLSQAILSGADLRGANLSGAILSRADLGEADLSGADLSGAILSGANLSRFDFSGINLSGLDLSGADLNEANLSRTQVLGTDFTGAKFTGACLEDWGTNSATKLNNVDCQYYYRKNGKQERYPIGRNFAPGEFTKLLEKALETVDLIFSNGVDWKAFAYSFRKIQIENESSKLTIRKIEIIDDIVLVEVNIPERADKTQFHNDFLKGYQFAKEELEPQYQARLSDKDKEINRLFLLFNQANDKLGEVPKLMAEQPKVQQNFHASVYGVAGNVEGDFNNYLPEQKQNLAEAAADIQKILNQLAQTNPTTDAVTEAIHQEIKRNPTLKTRLISALKAGVLEGLKTFVNHPLFNIPAETIKGFLEAE
ncbi:pentapeptide repeat-containing protein [Nostoc sp. 'Peltigera membranacea cyanobiont' N6]|uniref:pentapeptide repeat-containing protein n=1 Tax=Nostoc sp. 'Peltigera membranacea cyanobiont' N6 TaxID=1261031 RepID=UPI000CF328A9|nr:pentapeptide repeat-containing protein [Nostoc sp. 'Peltigera membranacea cyanobiont' N6]AVH68430.1 pentapeptide repeat-containing protein [Nostoc sp. 'Peltigera membranacea cyanobiont' N6]